MSPDEPMRLCTTCAAWCLFERPVGDDVADDEWVCTGCGGAVVVDSVLHVDEPVFIEIARVA